MILRLPSSKLNLLVHMKLDLIRLLAPIIQKLLLKEQEVNLNVLLNHHQIHN